ncbi:MAG: SDR family NAD(P)-dependent oxidoreductase [Candidatus Korobacteraceae bacterium]
MHDLTARVAFVTGIGSVGPGWGNGRATAVLLARQGAKVFGVDVNDEAACVTRQLVEKEGGICVTHHCDMMVASQVKAAVDVCIEQFGRIDILVNNVGASAAGDPVTMAEEVWDTQIDLNLKTAFLGCKYVLPIMEKQTVGAIVNIASIAGLRHYLPGGRSYVGYSAAKAGLIALGKATAMAYATKGIRCNTVVVGTVHTPLVEARVFKQVGGDAAALIAKRNASIPMGRMGDAWDVANAVLFLASDEARYITATELIVDGGISAARP